MLTTGKGQGHLAFTGSEHSEAGLLQVVAHDLNDVRFVVYDEDGLVGHRGQPLVISGKIHHT